MNKVQTVLVLVQSNLNKIIFFEPINVANNEKSYNF